MGKSSGEFLRNFSKLSLKTVIPQKSLILGTNSKEFLENFRGISYRKWFSRNSSEIPQRKSPRLVNLGKFVTFVTWVSVTALVDHIIFYSAWKFNWKFFCNAFWWEFDWLASSNPGWSWALLQGTAGLGGGLSEVMKFGETDRWCRLTSLPRKICEGLHYVEWC